MNDQTPDALRQRRADGRIRLGAAAHDADTITAQVLADGSAKGGSAPAPARH